MSSIIQSLHWHGVQDVRHRISSFSGYLLVQIAVPSSRKPGQLVTSIPLFKSMNYDLDGQEGLFRSIPAIPSVGSPLIDPCTAFT